jgi:hypothetical protein
MWFQPVEVWSAVLAIDTRADYQANLRRLLQADILKPSCFWHVTVQAGFSDRISTAQL